MKLLFTLTGSQLEALDLQKGEKLIYCVPADLAYEKGAMDRYEKDVFVAVTNQRLAVLAGDKVTYQTFLKDCEKVRCEHQVGCGIITVTLSDGQNREETSEKESGESGQDVCVARVSMRQIVRASYAVRGAQAIVRSLKETGDAEHAEQITSSEYETYCEKCGRALPGTSTCPYCEGKWTSQRRL